MELKAELSKLGIAPGRRRKAELVQILQEALNESDDPSTDHLINDKSLVSTPSEPETHPLHSVTQEGQSLQQSGQFRGRPRKINFVDIESLDDEQQVPL